MKKEEISKVKKEIKGLNEDIDCYKRGTELYFSYRDFFLNLDASKETFETLIGSWNSLIVEKELNLLLAMVAVAKKYCFREKFREGNI